MRSLSGNSGPDPNAGGGTPSGEETSNQASKSIDIAQGNDKGGSGEITGGKA